MIRVELNNLETLKKCLHILGVKGDVGIFIERHLRKKNIKVNKRGLVTKLKLHGKLSGTVPSELAGLSALEVLDLNDHRLTGPIPSELGYLSSLKQLYLSNNQLSGRIPPELGNLGALETLDVHNNQLSGPMPSELGNLRALEDMYLSNNELSGPIPSEFGNLSNMDELELSNNQLSGPMPPELGNLSVLEILDVHNNKLTGPIPSELGNLEALEKLFVHNNKLSGPIPSELGNLRALEILDVHNNQLTGPMPSELGNLRALEKLYLHDNRISGLMPSELGNLRALEIFCLHNNRVSGPIPSELGNLRALEILDVHNNQLSGPMPSELGNLRLLEKLYLHNNQLSGPMPSELGNLRALEKLDVHNNQLLGPLPSELRNLRKLEVFLFHNNQIEMTMHLVGGGVDISATVEDNRTSAEGMNDVIDTALLEESIESGKGSIANDKGSQPTILNDVPNVLSNETVAWNKGRVGVVGRSGVGKSCLVRSLFGWSNEESNRPTSTNACDKFECRKSEVEPSSDGVYLREREILTNELESRVAEIQRQKEEKKGKQEDKERKRKETKKPKQLEAANNRASPESTTPKLPTNTAAVLLEDGKARETDIETPPVKLSLEQDKFMERMGQSSSSSGITYTIYDYGGQDVFDSLHSMFFTKKTLFMIVFNMFKVCDEMEKGGDDELMFLEFWIERIVMYTLSEGKGDALSVISSILLVGTHYDKLLKGCNDDIAKIEVELNEKIETIIENIGLKTKADFQKALITPSTSSLSSKALYFAVDNINCTNRDVFNDIIRLVENRLEKAPHVLQKVPLAWIKCCDDFLSKAMDDNIVSLMLNEAATIMASYGVPRGNVEKILAFFHEMGILFWVDDDGLSDLVVLNPFEAFVKPIRTIICDLGAHTKDSKVHQHCSTQMRVMYSAYTKGKLDAKQLLPALLKEWEPNQTAIVKLMCKFGLMASLSEDLYLVPSLLKETDDFRKREHQLLYFICKEPLLGEEYEKIVVDRDVAIDLGYVQSGLFNHVMVGLIRNVTNVKELINFSFKKNAAILPYENGYYTIRGYKTHISLEIDKIVGDGMNAFNLASHVEKVIRSTLNEFKMKSFSVSSLLEYEDNFLSFRSMRKFVCSNIRTMEVEDMEIYREEMIEKHAPWVLDMNVDNYDSAATQIDFSDNVSSMSTSSLDVARAKLVILQQTSVKLGLDNKERSELVAIMGDDRRNKHFECKVEVCEGLTPDKLSEFSRNGDVLHFIGHSAKVDEDDGSESSVSNAATLMRANSNDTHINGIFTLSDISLSRFIGILRRDYPVKLVFLSMCDKLPLACMLMSKLGGRFFTVCWHGNVEDIIAHAFATKFYIELAYRDFDIIKAFDVATSNLLMGRQSSQSSPFYFPCLVYKSEDMCCQCELLRANWKVHENGINESFKAWFEELCTRNWDSEPVPDSHFIELAEESRDWLRYRHNIIGENEKLALEAIGFTMNINGKRIGEILENEFVIRDGRRHPKGYMLDDYKMVDSSQINAFWSAQITHNVELFEESDWPFSVHDPSKRNWMDLWKITAPRIVNKCIHIQHLQGCAYHLHLALKERRRKIQEHNEKGQSQHDTKNKNHVFKANLIEETIKKINSRIDYLNAQPQLINANARGADGDGRNRRGRGSQGDRRSRGGGRSPGGERSRGGARNRIGRGNRGGVRSRAT